LGGGGGGGGGGRSAWDRSPEWWGTQGGGWGRDGGAEVYRGESAVGNGSVGVTSHSCAGEGGEEAGFAWRVLRFNGTTRQSVVCVGRETGDADAGTVAFEYVKGMLAGGLAMGEAAGVGRGPARVLCLGLGGGTLPMFFAHGCHARRGGQGERDQADVHAVELDPVVVEAAGAAMGLDEEAVRGHGGDAGAWGGGREGEPFDLVFLDCFGGDDRVPEALVDADGPLCAALRSGRLLAAPGVLVVNQHGGLPPPGLMERVTRRFGPGYDPVGDGGHGRTVQRALLALVGALAPTAGGQGGDDDRDRGNGENGGAGVAAVTVATQSQDNVLLVAARLGPRSDPRLGLASPRDVGAKPSAPLPAPAAVVACLAEAADAAQPPGLAFALRPRAVRGLHLVC